MSLCVMLRVTGRRVLAVGATASLMLAVVGCSAGGTDDSAGEVTASATASVVATMDPDRVGVAVADVAPGLTIEVAADADAAMPKTYSDGRQGVTFHAENDVAPYTVIVEHYEPGGKSASEVLNSELNAFKTQGMLDVVTQTEASIEGGGEAYRLDWEQTEEVPWSAEDDTEIDLRCVAIIFDGQDGYSYAVYVYGDAANDASVAAINDVIDSIKVGQP